MATQTFKIDQSKTFAGLLFLQCSPKTKFGSDEQDMTKDGTPKWTLELLAAVRDSRGGSRNEVFKVGLTARSNPAAGMQAMTAVDLGGLEIGVMDRSQGGQTVFYRCDELLMAGAERTAA